MCKDWDCLVKEWESRLDRRDSAILPMFPMTHLEMRHSEVIASFLNEKECCQHFLEVLKKKLVEKKLDASILENFAKVDVEIEKDLDNLGRADIVIKGQDKKLILIENKIYAKEGCKQITKYQQFVKKKGTGLVVFLTLDGREPETADTDFRVPVVCLSYHSDILEWLRHCILNLKVSGILDSDLFLYYIYLKRFCVEYEVCNNVVKRLWVKPKDFEKLIENRNTKGRFYNVHRVKMIRDALMREIVLEIKTMLESNGYGSRLSRYCEDFSNPKYPGFCIVLKGALSSIEKSKHSKCIRTCLRFQVDGWNTSEPSLVYGISYVIVDENSMNNCKAYPVALVENKPTDEIREASPEEFKQEQEINKNWWVIAKRVAMDKFVAVAISQLQQEEQLINTVVRMNEESKLHQYVHNWLCKEKSN